MPISIEADPSLAQGYIKVNGTTAATLTATSATLLKVLSPTLAASTTYANDAAAATGGVAVGEFYRNGSAVNIRVS